jgi:hypothetical protein
VTLDEIWASHRTDTRLVAYRIGTAYYVALGCRTPEAAIAGANITDPDARTAADWEVGEIIADQFTGQPKDVIDQSKRGGNRDRVSNWGPNRARGANRFAAQDAEDAAEYETRRQAAENVFNAKVAELETLRKAHEAAKAAAVQAARMGGK